MAFVRIAVLLFMTLLTYEASATDVRNERALAALSAMMKEDQNRHPDTYEPVSKIQWFRKEQQPGGPEYAEGILRLILTDSRPWIYMDRRIKMLELIAKDLKDEAERPPDDKRWLGFKNSEISLRLGSLIQDVQRVSGISLDLLERRQSRQDLLLSLYIEFGVWEKAALLPFLTKDVLRYDNLDLFAETLQVASPEAQRKALDIFVEHRDGMVGLVIFAMQGILPEVEETKLLMMFIDSLARSARKKPDESGWKASFARSSHYRDVAVYFADKLRAEDPRFLKIFNEVQQHFAIKSSSPAVREKRDSFLDSLRHVTRENCEMYLGDWSVPNSDSEKTLH